jgi:hypothetical protein
MEQAGETGVKKEDNHLNNCVADEKKRELAQTQQWLGGGANFFLLWPKNIVSRWRGIEMSAEKATHSGGFENKCIFFFDFPRNASTTATQPGCGKPALITQRTSTIPLARSQPLD